MSQNLYTQMVRLFLTMAPEVTSLGARTISLASLHASSTLLILREYEDGGVAAAAQDTFTILESSATTLKPRGDDGGSVGIIKDEELVLLEIEDQGHNITSTSTNNTQILRKRKKNCSYNLIFVG